MLEIKSEQPRIHTILVHVKTGAKIVISWIVQ